MLTKSPTKTKLDAEILSAFEKLESISDKTSKPYGDLVEHIATLYKLKTEDRSKQISPDTVLVVAANIFGILWLTRYERERVIPSKSALGMVMKPR
jgi:hypothetical protein